MLRLKAGGYFRCHGSSHMCRNMAPSQIPLNVNLQNVKLGMGSLASLGSDIDLMIIATDQTKLFNSEFFLRKNIQKQTKKKSRTITSNQEGIIK
jgi:hypothetical protein